MKKTSLIALFLILSLGCGKRTVVRERTIIRYQPVPVKEEVRVVEKAPVNHFTVNYPKQTADGYFETGKIAYGNCNFQEAMRCFAVVLNSSAPPEIIAESYAYMGACCFYEGRMREAEMFCEKARKTYPQIRLRREEFPREVIEFCN